MVSHLLLFLLVIEYGPVDSAVARVDRSGAGLGVYAAEAGTSCLTGSLGGAVAGFTAGLIEMGISEGDGLTGFIGGFAIGYPVGCALGTHAVAGAFKSRGSFWGAFAGGCTGSLIAVPILWTAPYLPDLPLYLMPIIVITPPILSVVGYNIFAKTNKESSSSGLSFGVIPREAPSKNLGSRDCTSRTRRVSVPIVTFSW